MLPTSTTIHQPTHLGVSRQALHAVLAKEAGVTPEMTRNEPWLPRWPPSRPCERVQPDRCDRRMADEGLPADSPSFKRPLRQA